MVLVFLAIVAFLNGSPPSRPQRRRAPPSGSW
jgi:hypothetical protein